MNYDLLKKGIKESKFTFRKVADFVGLTEQGLRFSINNKKLTIEVFEKICSTINASPSSFFEYPNVVINGNQNQVHNGNGDQIIQSPEQKEIEYLKKIIEEKERIIQILTNR